MRLQDWEATIQTIADECNRVCTGADKVLMAWRVKLAKEPNLLQPYQIDEIVREVRRRLVASDRRSTEQSPLPVRQRHETLAILPQQGICALGR
jgi:hypothetical protein